MSKPRVRGADLRDSSFVRVYELINWPIKRGLSKAPHVYFYRYSNRQSHSIKSFIYGKINEIAFVYTQHAAASIYTKRDFNSLANLIYKSEERLCAVMILSE